jgi:cellulose synthase (UDP-forming)
MPDQFVLPRLDAGSVSAEQKGTVLGRQRRAAKRSEPLSIVHPRPSRRKMLLGRLDIPTTLGAWIACAVPTVLRELADNPKAVSRFQFETVSTDGRRRIAVR